VNNIKKCVTLSHVVQIVTIMSWRVELWLSLLQQEENVLGVWSRQPEGKMNRNLIFTTLTEQLLRTNVFLGVSLRICLKVSKNFERSRLLDPEDEGIRKGICNNHCFSTATMFVQTCLNVTLYYMACLVVIVMNPLYPVAGSSFF